MLSEIFKQAVYALMRSPTRSFLTMLGVVWGIVTVALLVAYGSSFRSVMMTAFDAFGKSVIVAWPGQTSEQAGGERAGRRIRLAQEDVNAVLADVTALRSACLETIQYRPITYRERLTNNPVRGVCPAYARARNEVPAEGRFINDEDILERRRVIFIGNEIRNKLFAGRPSLGETIRVSGMRFTVVGSMDKKVQFSNYYSSDDASVFIPYTTAGDLWDNRYGTVMVLENRDPSREAEVIRSIRASIAKRQRFSPTDDRAVSMFGRESFRPVIEGIAVGMQMLLLFIGTLTLGIGGVGVMNIMLVSVDERIKEIGLRRALGAKRWHIRVQFLFEALVITIIGGAIGMVIAYGLSAVIGPLPLLGPIFDDPSGKSDIHLVISPMTILVSTGVLMFVGLVSGIVPASRAAALDPTDALRCE
jgi:putative ABC transport system permease protein